MSNIYIQEPPSNGKVLLVTSVGDIDIELWSKECPKACRNFVQLCMEGYYDGTIFHRVVPDFIVQGGDPTGTGDGGESIYGHPFRDEIHSRLRFVRRGLVAMANAGRDDNGSQFFFTLGPTQELQGKHTIFGKVTGNTVYNMLKLAEVDIGADDRPIDPHKIVKTKVLHNPFDDIEPRKLKKKKDDAQESKKKKSTAKATKNFKLLSFGDEAEEDEEETVKIVTKAKKHGGGSKSSHDLLDDASLSTLPAVDVSSTKSKSKTESKREIDEEESEDERDAMKERIRKKLRTEGSSKHFLVDEGSSDEEKKQASDKMNELKKEAKRLKKELLAKDKKKEEEEKAKDSDDENIDDNELVKEYKAERRKYKEQKKSQKKKGKKREEDTLAMLSAFQTKLNSLAQFGNYDDEEDKEQEEEKEGDEEDVDDGDIGWMNHKLTFEGEHRKVLDANIAELDRYEIFDPRNPVTKRRREESKKYLKEAEKRKT